MAEMAPKCERACFDVRGCEKSRLALHWDAQDALGVPWVLTLAYGAVCSGYPGISKKGTPRRHFFQNFVVDYLENEPDYPCQDHARSTRLVESFKNMCIMSGLFYTEAHQGRPQISSSHARARQLYTFQKLKIQICTVRLS